MRPQATFKHGDIEGVVQKGTFGDQLDGDWLVSRLNVPITGFYRTFLARVLTQTVSVKGLDIALPAKMDVSTNALLEIYRTLREQDKGLMDAWFTAMNEADGEDDPALASGQEIDPAKKNNAESGENQ